VYLHIPPLHLRYLPAYERRNAERVSTTYPLMKSISVERPRSKSCSMDASIDKSPPMPVTRRAEALISSADVAFRVRK
jgi:hypothetical protein